MLKNTDFAVLKELALAQDALTVFVFGSILVRPDDAHDIDILVVYCDPLSMAHFRKSIEAVRLSLPVDLLAMTPEEEKHYRFIEVSAAERLCDLVNFKDSRGLN